VTSATRRLYRPDIDLRFERAVYWAFLSDFDQPPALLVVEVAFEGDGAVDPVDHSGLGFAFGAIDRVNPVVPEADLCPGQRPLMAIGVKTESHRGAGTERREQELVGTWAAVEPAPDCRLVRDEPMRAGYNFLLKLAFARFAYDNGAGRGAVCALRVIIH